MKNFFDHNINLYRSITPSFTKVEKMFKLNIPDQVAFRTLNLVEVYQFSIIY